MRTVRIEERFDPTRSFSGAAVSVALAVLALVFVSFYAMGRAQSKATPVRSEAAPTAAVETLANAIPVTLASTAPLDLGVAVTPERRQPTQTTLAATPAQSSSGASQATVTAPAATENAAATSGPATPAPASSAPASSAPAAPEPAPAAPAPAPTQPAAPAPSQGSGGSHSSSGGGGGSSSSGSGSFESSG